MGDFLFQVESGQTRALVVVPLSGGDRQYLLDLRGEHPDTGRRLSVGHRQTRTADEMTLAVQLFEHEGQGGAAGQCEWRL